MAWMHDLHQTLIWAACSKQFKAAKWCMICVKSSQFVLSFSCSLSGLLQIGFVPSAYQALLTRSGWQLWRRQSRTRLVTLNPIECGGGRNPPPLSYKCGSPKNAQRKSCQFFVTFPKYVNGVLETTFCSQITFGLTGRWQKWSKLAYFRKGGPCREQYDAKIINTYKCQLQHVARNFLVLFML